MDNRIVEEPPTGSSPFEIEVDRTLRPSSELFSFRRCGAGAYPEALVLRESRLSRQSHSRYLQRTSVCSALTSVSGALLYRSPYRLSTRPRSAGG
jgi:hypothetical protein